MGQNNDPAERGELQGNQGGLLSKDPVKEKEIRQKEEGYARPPERLKDRPPLGEPARPPK